MENDLFDTIFSKPKWSVCNEMKNEINKWLVFIQNKNQLKRYLPRLKDYKTRRDEALAEICSAYVIEVKLKYPVIRWEEKTVGGKDIDFIIRDGLDEIYCEVKSPGWESELKKKERLSGRKGLPKHINGESRPIAPWRAIRYALKKSYPKFLPNCKNLVIVNDDLFVKILDFPENIDIALFEDTGIYNNEKGYFVSNDFENIGGILILNWGLKTRIEYRYKFIANKNSKKPFLIRLP